jgi:hypothetical protein
MFAKTSVASLTTFFLVFTHSAFACLRAPPDRPKLEQALKTDLPVFIGTVVESGGPPLTRRTTNAMAKIRVEIPIRGEVGTLFELSNGGGGDCRASYEVGQRWFFSGVSTMLADEFGVIRAGRPSEVAPEEIFEMFPEVLKLPPISTVVQRYLNGK